MDLRPFNVLSLCSGVGGLDLGIKLAREDARTICYVEREAYCCEVLVERMEDGCLDDAPIWSDLQTFDGAPWRGVVDCVAGGIPCQPASLAGKRRGHEDRRWLWEDAARIVREVRPSVVFWENVPGLLSGDLLEAFRDRVVGPLEGMGYRVACGLFSAEEIGATHKRERVFVMAYRAYQGWPEYRSTSKSEGGRTDSVPQRGLARSDDYLVAHRAGRGRDDISSRPALCEGGEEGAGGTGAQGSPSARRRGSAVGDSYGERLPGWDAAIRKGGDERIAGEGDTKGDGFDVPPHPPGPKDIEGWERVLAARPDLAPALTRKEEKTFARVRGVAYGTAARVDRLRALGNAVVPEVAASAWRALMEELLEVEK